MPKEKIAITLEASTVAKLKAEVRARHVPSVSAYISRVVDESLESDALDRLVAEYRALHGRPSKKANAWARRVLGK